MSKKERVPVHRMDDWYAGTYMKPFGAVPASANPYEISSPHRHDFYYCVLVEKGVMEMEVDFQSTGLSGQVLFLSYPGQIHRIVNAQLEKGSFLAFDPAIIGEQLKDILDLCLPEILLLAFTPEQGSGLSTFINHLYTVYNDKAQPFHQNIVHSIVNALVYQVAAAYLSVETKNLTGRPARSIELTKTFRQLLRRNSRGCFDRQLTPPK